MFPLVPSRILGVVIVVLLLMEIEGVRRSRSKKTRQLKSFPPQYEQFLSNELPTDRQISIFLKRGISKELYYSSLIDGASLSFIVSTCTSSVSWSIVSKIEHNDRFLLKSLVNMTTTDMDIFHLKSSSHTTYVVEILTLYHDSFVHVYLSTEPEGPQAIKTSKNLELKLTRRRKRKQLTVSWEPSLVDPQSTVYCLVVNTKKHYKTQCSAQNEKYGIKSFTSSTQQPTPASQTLISWMGQGFSSTDRINGNFLINCIGHRTRYTVKNMEKGLQYYFDLFATNQQSNLTYHRGSSRLLFNNHFKPTVLRDGKSSFVNLKKHDGKVTFRFKIKKSVDEPLKLFVAPCGGAIDVEIVSKGQIIFARRRIERFDKLIVEKGKQSLRYYIKVMSSDRDELRRTSSVEILATTKPVSAIPLPELPSDLTVEEFQSLRQCNSVTVGWIPSTEKESIMYCVNVKQVRLKELEINETPNQCYVDNRMRKSNDRVVKQCKNVNNFQENVMTQIVKKLKPGRNYEIQVTAKKLNGREISYNALYVKTKPYCEKFNKARLKYKNRKENISI